MFLRRPCRAIDNAGNVVTLTETRRSAWVETTNGAVEVFNLPQMHDSDGDLLIYCSDGLYRSPNGRRYRIDEQPPL